MKRRHNIYVTILLLFFLASKLKAQSDPSFTQYMINPIVINPAYVGTRDAITLAATHRSQWLGLDSRISTSSFNFQTPVHYTPTSYGGYREGREAGPNVGFGIVSDQIWILNQLSITGDYSYIFAINETVRLGLGTRVGYRQVKMDLTGLTWADIGDPLLIDGFLNQRNFSIGLGAYLYERNRWYLSLSTPQMFNFGRMLSKNSSEELNIDNSIYSYFSGGIVRDVGRDMKLRITGLMRLARSASWSGEANAHVIFNEKLWVGAGYRINDAVILSLVYDIQPGVRIAYSYDWGVSSLSKFHSGTHEITLMWDLFPRSYKRMYHCFL